MKKRKNETQNDLPGGLKLAEIEDRSCHLNFELVGLCKARLQVAENKIKKKKGNKNLIRLFSSEQNCTPPPSPIDMYSYAGRERNSFIYPIPFRASAPRNLPRILIPSRAFPILFPVDPANGLITMQLRSRFTHA